MIDMIVHLFITLFFTINPLRADISDNEYMSFAPVDAIFQVQSYPIAKPLKGGPLRILFVGRHDTVRLMSMEVAGRLECQTQTLVTPSREHLGRDNSVFELFNEDWDVIWLDFKLNSLPDSLREALLERISKGTGLVFIGNKNELRSFTTKGRVDEKPLEAVSFSEVKPELAGKRDNGIMVIMPQMNIIKDFLSFGDYYLSAVNAILFVSGRNLETVVTKLKLPKTVEQDAMSLMNYRVELFHNGKPEPMNVIQRYRDEKGDVISESTVTYNLQKERSFILVNYPLMPIGKYSLDITVSTPEGVVAIAGTSFTVTSEPHISHIQLWDDSISEGDFIAGTVRLSSEFKEGMGLNAALVDCWGRIIDRSELEIVPSRILVPFSFLVRQSLGYVMFLQVNLYKSNVLVQTLEKAVYIKKPFDDRKFSFIVCDDKSANFYILNQYEPLRRAGVTTFALDVSDTSDPAQAFRWAINASLRGIKIIPVLATIPYSLNAETTISSNYYHVLEKQMKAKVDTLRHLDPPRYFLRDSSVKVPYEMKGDFSDTEVMSFHRFLKNKYLSIGTMNKLCNTTYSSFTDVYPITLGEAKHTGAFAVWLDSKLHRDAIRYDIYRKMIGSMSQSDSTVKVGMTSFLCEGNICGVDNLYMWRDLSDILVEGYHAGPGFSCESAFTAATCSCTLSEDFLEFLSGDVTSCPPKEGLFRYIPWMSLLSGLNNVWWCGGQENEETSSIPDFQSQAFSIVSEEVSSITNGIDLLLNGSSRHVDRIGILYSPISIAASYTSDDSGSKSLSLTDDRKSQKNTLDQPEEKMQESNILHVQFDSISSDRVTRSARSFYLACRDAGYTPLFIAEEQLKDNWLIDNEISVLFLPYTQSMTDEMVKDIKAFVEHGGTIIADMRPAVMNEHLVMRETGALDEVFGISQGVERTPTIATGTLMSKGIGEGVLKEFSIPEWRIDTTVTARDGTQILASVGNSPAIIINGYRKGKGIFLNMCVGEYEKLRTMGKEKLYRDIIGWCLKFSGIDEPLASICDIEGNVVPFVSTTFFQDNENVFIGVLMDPVADRIFQGKESKMIMRIRKTVGPLSVYDVRKGMFLGITTEVPITLSPEKSQLFALTPYRVRNVEVRVQPSVVKVGKRVEYTVTIIPQDVKKAPGRHVLRIKVTGPDGKERPYFSNRCEAVNGKFESSLDIALNEPDGRWILNVRDVVTGKEAERSFMVMATDTKSYE
ncbi:MAG TPA: beta-galactosidase trimerization domain-containing protein [Anaerolineae bacterium]|nr:beta-galactosidase trimerization domain-containing protein [Anaerolineae bacterium]